MRRIVAVATVALVAVGLITTQQRTEVVEATVEPYEIWHVTSEPEPDIVHYYTDYTPSEPVPEPEPVQVPVHYYDSDLPTEIQDFVLTVCEEYQVSPALIIAMIERESRCCPDAIGDGGQSFGLMQIQERWHEDRMARLGVTDLLDPEQNIRVGVDLVHELFLMNEDVYWVLMAYNGGFRYANNHYSQNVVSEYAYWVAERAAELEERRDGYVQD